MISTALFIFAAIVVLFTAIKLLFRSVPATNERQPMAVMNGSVTRPVWNASQLGCRLPQSRGYTEYDTPSYMREKPRVGELVSPARVERIEAAYKSPRTVMFQGQEFRLNAGETPEQVLKMLEQSGAAITAR